LSPAAATLGNPPGHIAEMCAPATVQDPGVPVATAFRIVHQLLVLVLTGPVHWRFTAPAPR
jgi:hypothetical protein